MGWKVAAALSSDPLRRSPQTPLRALLGDPLYVTLGIRRPGGVEAGLCRGPQAVAILSDRVEFHRSGGASSRFIGIWKGV